MTDEGVETAVGTSWANDAANLFAEMCSIMLNIFAGLLDLHMIVDTPPADAISAAMSFVSMPPVPSFDPSVAVLTSPQYCTECQGVMRGMGMMKADLGFGYPSQIPRLG